jgi:hypothetical protein
MNTWIRGFIIVAAILAFTIVVYSCYQRVYGGDTIQQAASQDNAVIAEVNTSWGGGATETAYTGVMLRSRRSPFRCMYLLAWITEFKSRLNGLTRRTYG